MSLGSYLVGILLFGLVVGTSITVAMAVASRHLNHLSRAPKAVAISLLATAVLIGLHLIPAALGLMTRGTVAVLAAVVLALSLPILRTPAAPRGGNAEAPDPKWSRALAGVAVAALAVYLAAVLARYATTPVTFIDTVTFHLPGAARWIQSQSIWQIDQFLPGQAQGYYPNNGNVVELAAILPWHSDFLIRFVNLPFLALSGLAVWAAGRELGAPRTTAAIAAVAALSVPAVTSYVVDSPTPDAVMYATFSGGVLFLLRHARSGDRRDLLLAGLGLGLAFGARWYGVAAVALVVAVWFVARLAFERRPGASLRDLTLIAVPIALAGGIWLIRNWVESGNPFFPVRVELFGATIFDAPVDRVRELVGYTLAGYLDDPDVLSDYVFPLLKIQLGFVAPVLGIGALAAGVVAIRAGDDPARARVLGLVAATVGLVAVYAITPYTALGLENRPLELGANARYVVPALLVAAPAVAWAVGRSGVVARAAAEAILVVLSLDAIRRGVDVSAAEVLAGAACVAAVVLLAFGFVAAVRERRLAWVAGLAALVGLIVLIGVRQTEDRYLDGRYAGVTPTLDAALARAPSGTKIGLAGAWPVTTLSPVLALFGPELANDVEYVGATRDGMLVPYATPTAYGEALNRGGYDLVMVGSEKPLAFPLRDVATWTRAAGYREIAADENFTLFQNGAG